MESSPKGLLETVFETTDVLIACMDRDFNFIRVNRAYAEADNHDPEFYAGKNHFDLFPYKDNEAIFRRVAESGRPHTERARAFEYAENPERGVSYWDWTLHPVRDDTGRTKELVLVLSNATERVLAERKKRESEKQNRFLSEILEAAPLSIKATNTGGEIIYVNSATVELYGYPKEEMLGKNPEMFNAEPNADEIQKSIFDTVLSGKVWSGEILNKKKNGETFPISAKIYSLQDSNDDLLALVSFQEDITERRKAEEMLLREKEFAESIVSTAQAIILVLDQDGRIVDFNPYMEDLTGYRIEEVKGKDWFDTFLPARDRSRIRDLFSTAISDTATRGNINPVVTRDGQEHQIIWYDKLLKYRDEARRYLLSIGHDITERERADAALRDSEAKWRSLTEHSPDHIMLLDREGKILFINRTVPDLTKEEVVGRHINDFTPPRYHHLASECFDRVLETGIPAGYETEYHSKDGSILVFDVQLGPVYGGEEIVGIVSRSTDVTERRHAQEQLKSLASQLSLAEEKERRRIATELHDNVGQILAAAKMKLGGLRGKLCTNEIEKNIAEAKRLCERAIAFTRSLTFQLSPPVLYEVGLEAAVEWLARNLEEQHGIRAEVSKDQEPKPLDDDIRVLLFQSVRELFNNVVRHARADRVRVSIERGPKGIRIVVEDDGTGFDVSAWGESDGFGLFNIRERLTSVGGGFALRSSAGKGTRIVITAPLKSDSNSE